MDSFSVSPASRRPASADIIVRLQGQIAAQKVRSEMQDAEHASTVAELARTGTELDQTENKLISARKEVSGLRRQLAGEASCQHCLTSHAAADNAASELASTERTLQMQRELKHQIELQLSEEQHQRQHVEGQLIEQRNRLQQAAQQLRDQSGNRAESEQSALQQHEQLKIVTNNLQNQAETAEKARRQVQRKLLEQKGAHDEIVKRLEQTLAEERCKAVANKHRCVKDVW